MNKYIFFLVFVFFVAIVTSAQTVRHQFIETNSTSATATIHLDQVSSHAISKGLFGKFTENLGHNVYGGFWAQVLENPSIEPVTNCKRSGKYGGLEKLHLNRISGEELLYDEQNLGYRWFKWNGKDCQYNLSQDAFNSGHSQQINIAKIPQGASGTGIRQLVYLPIDRESEYRFSCYVKGDFKNISASLEPIDGGKPSCAGVISTIHGSGEWTNLKGIFTLHVTDDMQGKPMWFCIGRSEPGELQIDQITMFPTDAVEGFDPEIVKWLKQSNISVLRFPGGNYVSGYHWKDDLVPMDKRPTMPNPAWDCCDPHHVGIDEHIRLCRLIGAEPLICVNAGNGTAQEAADLVQYCNGGADTKWGKVRINRGYREPFNIRLWEVGNELWGGWQIGHCSAKEYPKRYRAFHKVMKAADPTIKVIACGHKGDNKPNWNRELLEQCPEILESLSIHLLFRNNDRYSAEEAYLSQVGYSYLFEELFRKTHRQARKRGAEVNIAITEELILNQKREHPKADTLTEALYYAGALNSAMRTEGIVDIFTHSAIVNHGGGLRKQRATVFANPVYYARCELQKLAGGRLLACETACSFSDIPEWPHFWAGKQRKRFPLLDVMPVQKGDSLFVVLINRDPKRTMDVALQFQGGHIKTESKMWELSGKSYMSRNSLATPQEVAPTRSILNMADHKEGVITLKPTSLYVLSFKR
jgi:alpha-L-arabinofuranosidase